MKLIDKIAYRLQWIPGIERKIKSKRIKNQFKNEIQLINNNKVSKNRNGEVQSVLHFSINKSATQYVKSILCSIAKNRNMVPIHLHEYAFHSNFPYLTSLSSIEQAKYNYLFYDKGMLYTAFGGFPNGINRFHKFKIVFCVRDPRDVLVSGYYSQAFSHAVPPEGSANFEKFNEKRTKALNQSIDEFVLSNSKALLDNYSNYMENLLGGDYNYLTLKYELLVSDFQSWLQELFSYLDYTDDELFQLLIEKHHKQKPKKEDVKKHLRKGVQGDYLNKLQPDTIKKLNNEFSEVLNYFNYN